MIIDNLLQEFSENEIFNLTKIVFSQVYSETSMIQASYSKVYISNISMMNCSTSNENLIKIISCLLANFDYIIFNNCSSGFLTGKDSNISLTNSIFDNYYSNIKNVRSLIKIDLISKNSNISIYNCFFQDIHSLSSGGVYYLA